MQNKAKEIIMPESSGIFRTVFLYVGQGESTLLVIPEDENYKYMLVDSNLDKEAGGINLTNLLNDLLDEELDIFVNTHPHKDHIGGIKQILEKVGIKEVWHSGHIPGGEHKDDFAEFEEILKSLDEDDIYILKGSKSENKLDDKSYILGDINFNVLSPAEYVSDEIEEEKPEERYKRIHEQSGVIRFSYGEDPGRILITGDSDLTAWKDHITNYHKSRLPSNVLSASHHGSRTFFKEKEENEDYYSEHVENIEPTYLIISAPKQNESKHGHPHEDAIEIYKKYISEDNIFHLGNISSKRKCVIVDIDTDGNLLLDEDEELVKHYGFDNNGSGDKNLEESHVSIIAHTKLNNKPMG